MVETTTSFFFLFKLRVSFYSYEKFTSLLMNLNLKPFPLPSLVSCFEWTAKFFIANRPVSLIFYHKTHYRTTFALTNTKVLLILEISISLVMIMLNNKWLENILNSLFFTLMCILQHP